MPSASPAPAMAPMMPRWIRVLSTASTSVLLPAWMTSAVRGKKFSRAGSVDVVARLPARQSCEGCSPGQACCRMSATSCDTADRTSGVAWPVGITPLSTSYLRTAAAVAESNIRVALPL